MKPRRWRLLAHDTTGAVTHDHVYDNDKDLDAAMKGLERDPATAKVRVEPR